MWSRRILLLLPLVLAGLVVSTALPASAEVVNVRDPRGDAPAHVDVTKARYVNGPKVIRFRASVNDLRYTGRFWFAMSIPAGTDSWYVARVTKYGVRFGVSGNLGVDWRGCKGMNSTWRPGRDVVTARVPHSCVRGSSYRRALWLWVRSVSPSGQGDFTKSKTVRRG